MATEGDIVLCTVERIENTTVFVRLDSGEQGTIITSEVAPGRIRNLRDYVSPGRQIVCKVLRLESTGNIQLSLRRVTPKERKELEEFREKERNSLGILRSVLGQSANDVAQKIKKLGSLHEFLSNCKDNQEKLEEFIKKEDAQKVCKILREKKEKVVEVKKEFKLSSKKPDGIKQTKEILAFCKGNCDIDYLSAGRFTMKIKAHDFKKANSEITLSLEKIEKSAKEKKMDFIVSEK